MKLILAGVAALSLFACTDEVPTSGDTEINVVGTKSFEKPGTRFVEMNAAFKLTFTDREGQWQEFMPECKKCDLVMVHDNDGRVDDIQIWTNWGDYVCHTTIYHDGTYLENDCPQFHTIDL